MTTENVEVQASVEQEQMRLAQIQQVRNALVQNIFGQYYQFIKALQVLPVQQHLPGMQRAYGHIDDGMLWVKEILHTAPLVFEQPAQPPQAAQPKPEDAIAPAPDAETPPVQPNNDEQIA